MFLFIGTYTKKEGHVNGQAEGLYVYEIEDESGEIRFRSVYKDIINPSFVCVHPSLPIVYAVQELSGDTGDAFGSLTALRFDKENARLELLGNHSTFGLAPCYVSVDSEGRRAMVANYGNGTVAVFPLETDGGLQAARQVLKHLGNGPHPDQDAPHAHAILSSPDGKYVFATDKGADKIMRYQVLADGRQLQPGNPPFKATPAGAGPRHMVFHPNGRFAYVINELDATVIAYKYEEEAKLTTLQVIDTLPKDFEGLKACADIHIHPNGKFLYGSNRGHDSIVMYQIDPEQGTLTLLGHEWTRGQFPRNFMIHPNGRFLYAANQNSGSVVCFQIQQDGTLSFEGKAWDVPTPVCLQPY